MSDIINENFEIGDTFVGMINGAKLTVVKVGKDSRFYGTESGNLFQNKDIYVHFRNEETGKINRTNFKTAQRLLLKREFF